MCNTYSVYMHINKINQKKYIGLTKRKPELRWQNGTAYRNNSHFDAAIRKYGWDNFDHIILDENLNYEEACEKEKEYISKYCTTDNKYGYNMTLGGEGTQGYIFTEEQKQIMSDNNKGKNNPMFGRTGNKHPMFGKRGINNPNYGRHVSQETKDKISRSKRGKPWSSRQREIYMLCIKRGAESPKARPINQLSLNGDLLYKFNSLSEIRDKFGYDISNIVKVCKGKQKTAYGYKWEYSTETVDDDEKHLHSLTLKTGYDKNNPRTEFEIIIEP